MASGVLTNFVKREVASPVGDDGHMEHVGPCRRLWVCRGSCLDGGQCVQCQVQCAGKVSLPSDCKGCPGSPSYEPLASWVRLYGSDVDQSYLGVSGSRCLTSARTAAHAENGINKK